MARRTWPSGASIFPSISPRTVKEHWTAQFQAHADRILDALEPSDAIDFCRDFALPFSAECLKSITGLTNMRFQDMNAWSQAMIDGVANYIGDPAVEARCHAATAGIDATIDERVPQLRGKADLSLLGVMLASGMPMESVRANIKLAISGGQNEPRDAVAGCVWALLTHPDQLALRSRARSPWLSVFEEYARWISPIGMSPRRIAKPWTIGDVAFETGRSRLLRCSARPTATRRILIARKRSTSRRDVSKSIAFGAGPHFCAGAWASRAMVADVALPTIFSRLHGLATARGRAGPDRRLGVSRAAQPAGDLGRVSGTVARNG